jgi:hypothetical protein
MMNNSLESKEDSNMNTSNETEPFCTPIEVDAGWILDPTGVVMSAKNLAVSCKRNVLLFYRTGLHNDQYRINYHIQPDKNFLLADVKVVEVMPLMKGRAL